MKNLRKILKEGGHAVGSWINSCSPIVAELMAAVGFDFLTVDAEHSAVDVPQAQALFQAIRAGNPECTPLIRLPGNDYATTKKYLDTGAMGIIAPLINSKEQAQELVRAAKYPPQGTRGVGFSRANMYGMYLDKAVSSANEETLVCIQIEHIDGVQHIDDILSVPGVDAVFIGPYDLSASMGITGQFSHPNMIEARQCILDACKRHGVVPGIHIVPPDTDEVVQRFKEGYRLIAYSLDTTILNQSCQEGLNKIHDQLRTQKD